MDNRILEVVVDQTRLEPTEAELRVLVRLQHVTEATQVKGRLTGPRCPYASTVEAPYPLRELTRTADHVLLRAIIPEPSYWDPQSPFRYEGPLELWEGDQRVAQARLSHGIRHVKLGPRGLRLNGRALTLRGTTRAPADAAEAARFHQQYNLLLTDAYRDRPDVWALADQFGYFVVARCPSASAYWRWRTEARSRASGLAWVFPPELLDDELLRAFPAPPGGDRALTGVDWTDFPLATGRPSIPVDFLFCRKPLATVTGPGDNWASLPKLVLVDHLFQEEAEAPGVFGWVETA